MNRLKFRAWDEPNKEMLTYDACWFYEEDNGFHCRYKAGHAAPNAGDWVSCPVMQFTGLKDKNGVEIYEGDVLNVLQTDWPSQPEHDKRTLEECKNYLADTYVVGFHDGAFTMFFEGENDCPHFISCGAHGFIEVIGNIYENPELYI